MKKEGENMTKFQFKDTIFEGAKLIEPFVTLDNRGFLSKVYEKDVFANNGIDLCPYEELRSFSKKGVIRGLHFQRKNAQDKLIQVLSGAVYDVIVDLRDSSETFGKWQGFYLTKDNRNMLYVPKGFAHGFIALEDDTLFSYLCGDKYNPEFDDGIIWNDSDLNVKWPLEKVENIIVSDKDSNLQSFEKFKNKYGALQF